VTAHAVALAAGAWFGFGYVANALAHLRETGRLTVADALADVVEGWVGPAPVLLWLAGWVWMWAWTTVLSGAALDRTLLRSRAAGKWGGL